MAPEPSTLRNVHIVLVRPETAGNVGAVARIIQNFGLGELRIVSDRPTDAVDEGNGILNEKEAERLAHRSADVLDSARTFPELTAALADCAWSVAFSRRTGRRRSEPLPIRSYVQAMLLNAEAGPGAAVFGPESDGLSVSDLGHCDEIVIIPQRSPGPSLNLAQAVAIFGAEAFQAALTPGSLAPPERARALDLERVVFRAARLARHCGLSVRNRPEETFEDLRQATLKGAFRPHDLAVIERCIAQIEWFTGLDSGSGSGSES